MLVPGQVRTDCNTKLLDILDCLQLSAVGVVLVDGGIPFVSNPYNLTLVKVKLHEPLPFPLL